MLKNNISDPITDQEIAFARLVLSGTMTDRRAAEAVGLNPDTAAYTKSKPRVLAYLLENPAAVQQQLVEQDTGELRRFSLSRDQILARLWEIANLDPEKTRGSASAQVKALSMIVAIEGLIPDRLSDRRAVSAQNKSAPPPAPFYVAEWRRTQQDGESVEPQPAPAEGEAGPGFQSPPSWANDPANDPAPPTPGPTIDPSKSTFPGPLDASQTTSSPHPPRSSWVPDTRAPFSVDNHRFGRRY